MAKSYNFAMQALAGAVAAVGVAAIGAAAAFRGVHGRTVSVQI